MKNLVVLASISLSTLSIAGTASQLPTNDGERMLWSCGGQQGNADVRVTVIEKADGTFSGIVTKNTPNSNGSVRTHSWVLQNIKVESCGGFSPCDSVTDDADGSKLEMFVNYNNSFATSGFGRLKFTDLSVVQVDTDIGCTRVL
jgi:hypothetical protein